MRPAPESAEDLLESLELQPSADDLDGELSLAPETPAAEADEEEDIETFTVDEFQAEAPRPPVDPPRPRVDPKSTLVTDPVEAQEYRRKISRPPHAEVSLEELDEEDVEELSHPAASAPSSDGPSPVKAGEPAPASKRPPGARDTLPPVPSGSRPGVRPVVATAPVAVQLGPGQSEISIPVDVTLTGGTTPIHVHVRLSLHLKQSS
jgi:hypothetical protein